MTNASVSEQAAAKFRQTFGTTSQPLLVSVPGRVNLIGEHIDYHDLPVLPIAIQKRIAIAFLPRADRLIRAVSDISHDPVEFALKPDFISGAPGHWSNYVTAAAHTVQTNRAITNGIDAFVASDLPYAAGLSSSSALLVGFSLALLAANGIQTSLKELTALLPVGEHLVGTRGGAMDHVAILGSRAGFATLIRSFAPLTLDYVPIPEHWRFLVAHSLINAEKSGTLRSEYNARRAAGSQALEKIDFASYRDGILAGRTCDVSRLADERERDAFLHVTSEAQRVQDAVSALKRGDLPGFGALLSQSHASLRDRLRVSLPDIDDLIESALEAGAYGARITGAGFGGCVVCLCSRNNVESVRARLLDSYYAHRTEFRAEKHLFVAEPSGGALNPKASDDSDQHGTADDRNCQ